MKNPHEMLMRAKDVLESLNKPKISGNFLLNS